MGVHALQGGCRREKCCEMKLVKAFEAGKAFGRSTTHIPPSIPRSTQVSNSVKQTLFLHDFNDRIRP